MLKKISLSLASLGLSCSFALIPVSAQGNMSNGNMSDDHMGGMKGHKMMQHRGHRMTSHKRHHRGHMKGKM